MLLKGAAVAIAGAVAVGVFSGVTDIQSAKAAVLAAWLVGLTIHRGSRDPAAATGAGLLSLAGAALASVIGVVIQIVKVGHVPFWIVAAHLTRVLPLVPRVIGWFGIFCWALAACVGWVTVRRRGRASPLLPSAAAAASPAGMPIAEPDGAHGNGHPAG